MSSSKSRHVEAPYHHGDLRQALIEATEALLAERGADGFSLREVARRAGVSPSAPAHHFGDAAGLIAEVCTLAFEQLAAALRKGEADAGGDPKSRLVGQGLGYVDFAMREPARFRLMFQIDMREPTDALKAAADAAFGLLDDAVAALLGKRRDALNHRRTTLAMWALVHGYGHLAIAGRLDWLLADLPRQRWLRQVVRPAIEQLATAMSAPASARRVPRPQVSGPTARRPSSKVRDQAG